MASTPTSLEQFKSNFESSGVLPRDFVNRVSRMLSNITGDNGITVLSDFGRGLRIRGLGDTTDDFYKRFRLDWVSSASVMVNAGILRNVGTTKITKADTTITAAGNDVDGYGTPFAAGTYYAYLEMYHATTDIQLTADAVKIVCATTIPEDDHNRNKYYPLGQFTVAADLTIAKSTVIRYWIGDIDLVVNIPDAEMSPALDYPLKSIEWRQASQWQQQLYDLDAVNLLDGAAWEARWGFPGLLKGANNDGVLQWLGLDTQAAGGQKSLEIIANQWQIYKMNAAAEAQSAGHVCLRTAAAGELYWVDVDNLDVGRAETAGGLDDYSIVPHTDLDFTGSGTIGTGNSGHNTDHDDQYWPEYATSSYTDTKTFRTSGEVWADDFCVNDADATNKWNAETFLVDVTAAIGLIAGGGMIVNPSVNGTGDLELGTAAKNWENIYMRSGPLWISNTYTQILTSALEFDVAGDAHLNPTVDGAGTCSIGTGAKSWANLDLYSSGETDIESALLYIGCATIGIDTVTSFKMNQHEGLNYDSGDKLRIPTSGGGYVDAYCRHGILTVD